MTVKISVWPRTPFAVRSLMALGGWNLFLVSGTVKDALGECFGPNWNARWGSKPNHLCATVFVNPP